MFVTCLVAIRSIFFFFFKQKTAYELRISDWSSDVCSSDLDVLRGALERHLALNALGNQLHLVLDILLEIAVGAAARHRADAAHEIGRASCRERVGQDV